MIIDQIKKKVPKSLSQNLYLKYFSFTKIPLLAFISPKILKIDNTTCEVQIPLSWRTKNHLNSMYFAVLAAGADVAGGLLAMKIIEKSKAKVSLSFKDFHADFFKRVEGDALFVNNQGKEIRNFVFDVINSEERMNLPLKITIYCPEKFEDEPVGECSLTLSLKKY